MFFYRSPVPLVARGSVIFRIGKYLFRNGNNPPYLSGFFFSKEKILYHIVVC